MVYICTYIPFIHNRGALGAKRRARLFFLPVKFHICCKNCSWTFLANQSLRGLEGHPKVPSLEHLTLLEKLHSSRSYEVLKMPKIVVHLKKTKKSECHLRNLFLQHQNRFFCSQLLCSTSSYPKPGYPTEKVHLHQI